jgi:hypothetical protein
MTDRELDRMMQHVLLDAIKRDCEKETDDVPAFKPTRHYQRQIAAMLKDPLKWERRRARPLWKNVAQKAAVILLVFSLSLGSLMAVSPTVRAAVVRWVTEWYETHIVYRYSGEDISGEMPQYEISGLPQDYTEIIRDVYEASVSVVYESPSGDMICFDYTYMQQGAANIIAPGDDEILDVTVNGIQGQFFLPHDPADAKTITWIDADSNLQFVVKAFCSETDILHIAESVSLVKTEK